MVRYVARRSAALTVVALGVVALGVGCSTSAYHEVQDHWTRHHEAYQDLESRAFIYATLKTEPFRRAYADEYARIFDLDARQRAALVAAELEELGDGHVVIAAFYTPNPAWNNLDPDRGIWDVRLEGPDHRFTRPFKITRLPKRNPTWRALYPYFHPQYTLYELRFESSATDGAPLAARGEPLDLVIAGAPTRIRLSWTLP